MNRSGTAAALFFIAAIVFASNPAYSEFAGIDRNGDMSCDPAVDMGIADATAGSVETFDFYFDGTAIIYSWACTFCVTDKDMLTDPHITMNIPATWDSLAILDLEVSTDPPFLSPAIKLAYPDARCWQLTAANFGLDDPVALPWNVLDFQYTVAQDGCIGFVIDPDCIYGTGLLPTDFNTICFAPEDVCAPFQCPGQTSTEPASWGDVKTLFR